MYDYPAKRSDKYRDKGDDGDTILFIADQGMHRFAEEAVRLDRVTAPESHQFGGTESAVQLRLMCEETEERARVRRKRWAFMVYTQPNTAPEPAERQSFSRWMGTVWAFDAEQTGELSINAQMIAFLRLHPEWGDGITVPFRRRERDE